MIETLADGQTESVSRRGFLRFSLTAAVGIATLGGGITGASDDAMAAEFSASLERIAGQIGGERRLSFSNTHTGEKLVTTFWRRGGYEPAALDEINYIMRDFRTGDVQPINTGLLNLLAVLGHRLGTNQPVNIISGYRSPKTNTLLRGNGQQSGVAKKSFHMKGMAIDVRIPGIRTSGIAQEARRLGLGGVGYYSASDFVHVDVGPARAW